MQANAMPVSEGPALPAVISRHIGDKLYERRKVAALEAEALVQALASRGQLDQVFSLVDTLAQQTYHAPSSSHTHTRKGGLLCLAATAVGLAASGSEAVQTEDFLRRAVPPILASFTDPDARVRYYSLEALYNVAKSANPGILTLFPEIFDALFRLCSDTDTSVQSATAFTAGLIKDYLAESASFDFDSFVPTLQACLAVDSSAKRQFLLGWLSFFDSLPQVDIPLLRALPRLLPGMVDIVGDEAPEVQGAADRLLRELAEEIHKDPSRTDVGAVAAALACSLNDSAEQTPTAVRVMSLHWLARLVDAAPTQLAAQLPVVLRATLACVDSIHLDISNAAAGLDEKLLACGPLVASADPGALMEVAAEGLSASQEAARLEALRWAHKLLQTGTPAALNQMQSMLSNLCEALSSASDQVVQETAAVLAVIAARGEGHAAVLGAVLDCFRGGSGGKLLQRRGTVIVEKLCGELGASLVLGTMSELLGQEDDVAFGSLVVAALNLILLTSPRLQGARTLLQSALHDAEGAALIRQLFLSFSLSSGAAMSLALLGQLDQLAADIVAALAEPALTAAMSSTVVDLSQVVSLLEAPPFASIRLQLLNPAKRPALVTALYSMLMLLPQGEAFHTLQQRLQCIPATGLIERNAKGYREYASKLTISKPPAPLVDEAALLDDFVRAQMLRFADAQRE